MVAKAMNDKVTEEALKIEEMSAQEKVKHVFRIAKVKANNKKHIMGNHCMRGQDGQLKLRLKDRLNLWKDCCEELLNKENPWASGLKMRPNIGPVQNIISEEVSGTGDVENENAG